MDSDVYQLAGSSFRKSQPEELKMINQLELQIVRSRESETISQLSERTGNKLDLTLTALINDLNQQSPLKDNSVIIRGVPYQVP